VAVATRSAVHVEAVTARAPDGTLVLDDVSFAVERGWVVAVVGPTGAGKTTLVNALAGAISLVSGHVRLDGDDVATNPAARRRVGIVPQDDVLHPQLDLRRTLEYAAALRAPGTSTEQRARRVTAVLAELGLTAHAQQAVATLSGGQRKRANMASELVGDPDVLVLDEPTSGLDPGYEKSVLASLRQLADAGRTVLVVTHSVRALDVCDRVLFLAPGGRVAFFGPPAEAREYFGDADTADVFLALHEPGQRWKERFRSHPAYSRWVDNAASSRTHGPTGALSARTEARPAGPWRGQLATLLRRYVDLIRADRRHLAMLALQGPLLGLLLWAVLEPGSLAPIIRKAGIRVGPGAPTVILFLAISATWLGTSLAAREIVKEHRILRQERGTGLSVSAYVASKALALGVIAGVAAAVLTLIAIGRQAVPDSGAMLGSGAAEIALVAALAGVAAMAVGLMLSAVVTTPDKALTILPMALVAQLVFAGPWVSVRSTPVLSQLREITSARWAVDGMQATITGDRAVLQSSIVMLVAITTGALALTVAFARRRVRVARPASVRIRFALPAPLVGAAAGVLALAGTTSAMVLPRVTTGVAAVASAPLERAPASPAVILPQSPEPAVTVPVTAPPSPAAEQAPPTTSAPRVPSTAPARGPLVEIALPPSVNLPPVTVPAVPVTVPVLVPEQPAEAPESEPAADADRVKPAQRFAQLVWDAWVSEAQHDWYAWPYFPSP
jgi:ABC-type multidrug transport system ATPase subunit